jgi:hypothetical protein
VFTALGAATGALAAAKLWASTTGHAHDATDRITYNTTTGQVLLRRRWRRQCRQSVDRHPHRRPDADRERYIVVI